LIPNREIEFGDWIESLYSVQRDQGSALRAVFPAGLEIPPYRSIFMSTDRYVRVALTVIAGALLYLCAALTPGMAAMAQSQRPGEISTTPIQVIVVGWRAPQGDIVPVAPPSPLRVEVQNQVRVSGDVRTSQSDKAVDRVVIAGWEDRSTLRTFDSSSLRSGLPVISSPRQ
jgi:hypothetical protein